MSRWHVQLHITLIVERDISTFSTANILNYCSNKWPNKKQKTNCFNCKSISGNYDK